MFNYKINCIKDKNHRSILPSNVSSISIQHFKPSIRHNCILIIRACSRVCTIVLQLLHNLPINPNVCFPIISSNFHIP